MLSLVDVFFLVPNRFLWNVLQLVSLRPLSLNRSANVRQAFSATDVGICVRLSTTTQLVRSSCLYSIITR